jgi:hypothetical protein
LNDETIQKWRDVALNGRSVRIARTIRFTQPGDEIIGVVVQTGMLPPSRFSDTRPFLDLKCLAGEVGGENLIKDDWYRVHCTAAALRSFVERESPQVGDVVAVEYRGLERFENGTSRHDIIAGAVRAHELGEDAIAVPAGSERPW